MCTFFFCFFNSHIDYKNVQLKTNELKYVWSDYADFFQTDYVTETNDMHTIDLAFRGKGNNIPPEFYFH